MSTVSIKSGGRFINTEITIDERVIEPGNLLKVTLFYEPQIQQVALELNFLNEESHIERFSGINVDDELYFKLNAMEEGTLADWRIAGNKNVMTVGITLPDGLHELFRGAPLVLEIAADGWALQMNKYFNMMPTKEA